MERSAESPNEGKVKPTKIELALKQRTKISLRTLGKLKRRRRKRLKAGQSDDEDLPKAIPPSVVYIEDPSNLNQRSEPMPMDIMDFWHFLQNSFWKGRLRVCEGELLNNLLDCFDDLVQSKAIGKVTTTRKYRMRNNTQSSLALSEEETHLSISEKGKVISAGKRNERIIYYGNSSLL